jgi:hypothetical protein
MARPIYGVGKNYAAQYGCCDDLQDIGNYITKNTQILAQLLSSQDKSVAKDRLNLMITELQARLASSLTVIPITTNVPVTRDLLVKKRDSPLKNP